MIADKNLFNEVLSSGKATHYKIANKKPESNNVPKYFVKESLGQPERNFSFFDFLERAFDKIYFNIDHHDDVVYRDIKLPVEEKSIKMVNICILCYRMIDIKASLDKKKATLSNQSIFNKFISRHKSLLFLGHENKINAIQELKDDIEHLENILSDFKDASEEYFDNEHYREDYSIFEDLFKQTDIEIEFVPFNKDISTLIPTPLDTSKTLYLFDSKKNKISTASIAFNGVRKTSFGLIYLDYNLFKDGVFYERLNVMNDDHIVDNHIALHHDYHHTLFFDKETLKTFLKGIHRKAEIKFKSNISIVDKMP